MDYAVRNMTNNKFELNYARGSEPGVTQGQIVLVTPTPSSFQAKVSNIGSDKIELIPEPNDGKFMENVHIEEIPLEE